MNLSMCFYNASMQVGKGNGHLRGVEVSRGQRALGLAGDERGSFAISLQRELRLGLQSYFRRVLFNQQISSKLFHHFFLEAVEEKTSSSINEADNMLINMVFWGWRV